MIDINGFRRCDMCGKLVSECYQQMLFYKKYKGIDCMDFEGECCCECIHRIEGGMIL